MSTTDTPPDEAMIPQCGACHRQPVQKPGAVAFYNKPGSAHHQEAYTPNVGLYCPDCLDRCGNSEDPYHRCPVCRGHFLHEQATQPDTSIEDNECQCSIIERCAMCRRDGATTSAYDDGINPACGCPRKAKCDSCTVCTSCDGCYCNED